MTWERFCSEHPLDPVCCGPGPEWPLTKWVCIVGLVVIVLGLIMLYVMLETHAEQKEKDRTFDPPV